jgi:arabinofuranan 3-O-arabinosyltransferase
MSPIAPIAVRLRALTRSAEVAVLALLAYLPFLASSRGKVSGDTKQYLYLDPGHFLARAPYLWDPQTGAGTVTHQQIGYLFPMGPWFWIFDRVGAPDWIAQRLWLGTITFAAALGARWLLL